MLQLNLASKDAALAEALKARREAIGERARELGTNAW